MPPTPTRCRRQHEQHRPAARTSPLFEGDDRLFRQEVAACRVYGEYGCGSDTIWVTHHSYATATASATKCNPPGSTAR